MTLLTIFATAFLSAAIGAYVQNNTEIHPLIVPFAAALATSIIFLVLCEPAE